jgi:hypothetical protein
MVIQWDIDISGISHLENGVPFSRYSVYKLAIYMAIKKRRFGCQNRLKICKNFQQAMFGYWNVRKPQLNQPAGLKS